MAPENRKISKVESDLEKKKRAARIRIQKRKKARRVRLFLVVMVTLLFLFTSFYLLFKNIMSGSIDKNLVINVGEHVPSAKDYIKSDWIFGYFKEDIRSINTNVAGEYDLNLVTYGINYNVKLKVVDDKAPTADIKDIKIVKGKSVLAENFVSNINDDTSVDVSYVKKPDFSKIGIQDVEVKLVDMSGNETILKSKLEIYEDNNPPKFSGITDLTVNAGNKISYRSGVKAYDDEDGEIDYEVDSSNVDVSKVGDYDVTYTATDSAGNKANSTVKVFVLKADDTDLPTSDDVNELADKVLARIITDDMTYIQKLRAIYDYVFNEIAYVGRTDRINRIQGAYEGMKYKRGDCYNFYAVSMALINRIGGESMYVARTPNASTRHFWIIVKYEDKWYHFDPSNSPTRKNFDCFMKSDPEVEAFTKEVWNIIPQYYEYEKSDYPAVSQEPLVINN